MSACGAQKLKVVIRKSCIESRHDLIRVGGNRPSCTVGPLAIVPDVRPRRSENDQREQHTTFLLFPCISLQLYT